MIKWTIAAIPALFILAIVTTLFVVFAGGLIAGFARGEFTITVVTNEWYP